MTNTIDDRLGKDKRACIELAVEGWSGGRSAHSNDWIAEETAVALVYNGVSHAVMMASPVDLDAFALGFSLTEGIIDSRDDLYDLAIQPHNHGLEISMTISSRCFTRLKNKRRVLTGRSGCGICGVESLDNMRPPVSKVEADVVISHRAIDLAVTTLNNFQEQQTLQALTGAVHSAAWCDVNGAIIRLCEDVGRHNALDKLIGALWLEAAFQRPGFLLMSSRASYEILQKSAKAGIAIIAAVSAPTSLAITIAQQADITLLGFCRENRHVTYTNERRLID